MTTLTQVKALAAIQNVKVTKAGGKYLEYLLEAPSGFWFGDIGVHELVYQIIPGSTTREQIFESMLQDLMPGVSQCTKPDCEWCEESTRIYQSREQRK